MIILEKHTAFCSYLCARNIDIDGQPAGCTGGQLGGGCTRPLHCCCWGEKSSSLCMTAHATRQSFQSSFDVASIFSSALQRNKLWASNLHLTTKGTIMLCCCLVVEKKTMRWFPLQPGHPQQHKLAGVLKRNGTTKPLFFSLSFSCIKGCIDMVWIPIQGYACTLGYHMKDPSQRSRRTLSTLESTICRDLNIVFLRCFFSTR